MVDGAAGDHQAWVQGASSNSTERVPCSVVKPIPELVEAIGDEVLGCSEVEPGINWTIVVSIVVSGIDWGESCALSAWRVHRV